MKRLLGLLLAGCGAAHPCAGDCSAPVGCDPGYVLLDDTCVPDACTADPCLHGTCTTALYGAVCACEPGFAGAACEHCADGLVAQGDSCVVMSCDTEPCVYGLCVDGPAGATCECDAGLEGALCDSCADGLVAVDLSCVTADPCDPDPCAFGRCTAIAGQAVCACQPGFAGPTCGACADGFLAQGLSCVELGQTSPCQPNPCAEPDRGLCQPSGASHVCLCEPGFRLDGATCVPGEGCDTLFTFVPGAESISGKLYLRGDFNGWAADTELEKGEDGVYRATLGLDAGDYAYKLYDAGGDRWFLDATNPYVAWVAGEQNSRLHIADCEVPRLVLEAGPVVTDGRVQLTARYVDGSAADGLETLEVSMNDAPLAVSPDADGRLVIDETDLADGKYAFRVRARDAAGRDAIPLYVPVWIEAEPFRWEDAILYFVFTDRFVDGDPSNDAPVDGVEAPANWRGGDFAGVRQKIESGYFEQLGVNTLWLSSVIRNTQGAENGTFGRKYTAYHSYWPMASGYSASEDLGGGSPIEPHFGDEAELRALVAAAHERGLRVIVDWVGNHVHDESPLYSAHPEWFNPLYICGWDKPISCWFDAFLPDFDYTHTDLVELTSEHAAWMATELDLDGFRVDAVKHMVHDITLAARARVTERIATPNWRFYMVGETFTGEGDGEAAVIKQWVNGRELDGQFDFPLYWAVLTSLLREERSLHSLRGTLEHFQGYYGPRAVMSTFLGNHDVPRALSHAAGNIADMWGNGAKEQAWNAPPGAPSSAEPYQRLRLAWTFLFTVPGVPLVYYGDEIGMPGAGDPDNRRMMRFDGLAAEEQATKLHVGKLAVARREHPALRYGTPTTLLMDGDGLTWAYGASYQGDVAVVVLNRRPESVTRMVPLAALGFASGQVLHDVVGGGAVTTGASGVEITVPGHGSAVLVKE